ncbi:MarR family winged helix-turn-helix transcriptional regulator [Saccharibacillus sacchari]|uniref:MarR family transcriptional regulator n=1 Tax=Saccharibacillus sacchari TaxID=456493 RepID=A0ACC6P7N8_9BACL
MKNNLECDIRQTLDRISAKMRRDYSEALRELNLYVGQDNLLSRLWLGGDGVTQMQLCEYLKCEPPTVTNMVRSLEQNGFIYRIKDKDDARIMRIFLTERGRELEAPVTLKWEQQQKKLLHSILPNDRSLLRKLLKQMENDLF